MPRSVSHNSSISNSDKLTQHVQMLSYLADKLNINVDVAQARKSVDVALKQEQEPMAILVRAAALVGLRLQVFRMPLAEALWKARDEEPLIVWGRSSLTGWQVLCGNGFFHARVVQSLNQFSVTKMSRSDLAKKLGLDSVEDEIELAVVTPERPAEGLSGKAVDQSAALLPAYHIHHADDEHSHASPMKRFLQLLQPEWKDIITIILFSLISGVLYLALPLAVNSLVSNLAFGAQSAPFLQALVILAVAVFVFFLVSALIRGLQFYMTEVIQRRLFVRVASDMAYRLPRVKMDSLDGVHAPEMVNRFLDVVTLQKSTALLLLDGVNLVLSGSIGLIVLGFYHPFLLTFTVLMLMSLVVIIFGLGRSAVKTSIQESRSKYEMVNWLEELARYPRLFKGPGGYNLATERADQLARGFLKARTEHFRILIRQMSGLLLLEVLASAALLLVGGWLVLRMELTLGQLVASELIISAVVASIAKLGKQFEAWYDAMAAVDKLSHLTDLEIETEDGDISAVRHSDQGARVDVDKLGFAYPDGRQVFCEVSFNIQPGDKVALTGSQGSGCSTLLDLLLSMRQPTSGHVSIDGIDTRSWYLEELRSTVMLLRTADIVSGTIAENIRLGLSHVGMEQVQDALKQVGLLNDVLSMPHGMHMSLVTGGLPFSSRQKTRLLLARAVIQQPRLLLIDDVFDGMDPDSIAELAGFILAPERPWTVIITSRDPAILKHCNLTINMDDPACHSLA